MEKEENAELKDEEYGIGNSKLFNFRPVFFVATFLCLGLVFANLTKYHGVSLAWAFLLLPVVVTPFFFCQNAKDCRGRVLATFSIALAFFLGFFSFSWETETFERAPVYQGEYTVSGTVVEKEKNKSGYQILLRDVYIDGERSEFKLVAYLPTASAENLRLCEEVIIVGNLKTDVQIDGEDNWAFYDLEKGVAYEMNAKECTAYGYSFDLFLFLRERVERVLYAGMGETEASVTLGVLTGDTSRMDGALLQNVRYGGIAHIFAVSGLHIGALFAVCVWFFSKTKLKKTPKIFRFCISAFVLLFYGGICSFTPSVNRAIVTCLVFYGAKLLGVSHDSTQSLALSAILVLLISPVSLFTVGFQLSYSACLGIFWLAPILFKKVEKRFSFSKATQENRPLNLRERGMKATLSFACVSTVTQLATAPILYLTFSYFSLWGFFLNSLFVPLIGGVFSLLLAFVFLACVLPTSLASLILYLPSVIWSAVLLLFQTVDFSTFVVSGFLLPSGACVCYYLGLIFCTDKWNFPKILSRIFYVLSFLTGLAVLLIANL